MTMTGTVSTQHIGAAAALPPFAERAVTLDTRRPRALCRCAAAVATALMRAGRVPAEDRREALTMLEEGLERVRRSHPEAWRAERHVDALGRLMALDALAAAQPKASGSAALRSAT